MSWGKNEAEANSSISVSKCMIEAKAEEWRGIFLLFEMQQEERACDMGQRPPWGVFVSDAPVICLTLEEPSMEVSQHLHPCLPHLLFSAKCEITTLDVISLLSTLRFVGTRINRSVGRKLWC